MDRATHWWTSYQQIWFNNQFRLRKVSMWLTWIQIKVVKKSGGEGGCQGRGFAVSEEGSPSDNLNNPCKSRLGHTRLTNLFNGWCEEGGRIFQHPARYPTGWRILVWVLVWSSFGQGEVDQGWSEIWIPHWAFKPLILEWLLFANWCIRKVLTKYVSKHFTTSYVLLHFRGMTWTDTLKSIAIMEQVDVAVIGGGPTGLFVALLLQQLNVSIRVLGKFLNMVMESSGILMKI